MTQLEQNLDRILKVRDVDLGLFILAMHSLMEKTLKENTILAKNLIQMKKMTVLGNL